MLTTCDFYGGGKDKATPAHMIDLLQAETGQVPEDFLQELYKWALECIGVVALNRQLGCLEPNVAPGSLPMQLIRIVNELFSVLATTELGFPFWQYFRTPSYKKLETSHQTLATEAMKEAEARLEEAKAQGDPDRKLTIMETFLNTEGLSRSDVATIILDMLFAGIDTTSHTVGFALYLLARNPKVQEGLQQKVDAVVKRDEPLTPEHIVALDCVVHTVKETLRLYPLTFSNVRILSKDVVLSGYRVPAGVSGMIDWKTWCCQGTEYLLG
ncbi:Cytochrome P450 [Trinorchestia longiramus]|nr:Cytochrome P450 [Trinorchestia longiramus]